MMAMSSNNPQNQEQQEPQSPSFQLISSLRYDPSLPEFLLHSQSLPDDAQKNKYPEPRNTPYYLLPYHRDRLINAAEHFNWVPALRYLKQHDLSSFVRVLDSFIPDTSKPWRLRIVLDSTGVFTVEANPTGQLVQMDQLLVPSGSVLSRGNTTAINTTESGSDVWRVYVDSQVMVHPSPFTTHKTTARDGYNSARVRVGIRSPRELAEVLLVNPRGEVMEGSITTPYIRRRPLGRSVGDGPGSGADAVAETMDSPEWITPPLSCGGNAGTTRRYALAQGFCDEQVIKSTDLVDGEECWLSNGVRGFMRGVVVLDGHPGSRSHKQH